MKEERDESGRAQGIQYMCMWVCVSVFMHTWVCVRVCLCDSDFWNIHWCTRSFHSNLVTHKHTHTHTHTHTRVVVTLLGIQSHFAQPWTKSECVIMCGSIFGRPTLSLPSVCLSLPCRFIVNQFHLLTALAKRPLALSMQPLVPALAAGSDEGSGTDMMEMVGGLWWGTTRCKCVHTHKRVIWAAQHNLHAPQWTTVLYCSAVSPYTGLSVLALKLYWYLFLSPIHAPLLFVHEQAAHITQYCFPRAVWTMVTHEVCD